MSLTWFQPQRPHQCSWFVCLSPRWRCSEYLRLAWDGMRRHGVHIRKVEWLFLTCVFSSQMRNYIVNICYQSSLQRPAVLDLDNHAWSPYGQAPAWKFITLQSQCLPPNVTIPRDCLAPDNFREKRAIGVAVHDSMLEDPLLKSGSIQRYFAELCVLHEGLKHWIKPRLSLAKQSFKANIQRSTVDNVKTCKDPITESYRSYRL